MDQAEAMAVAKALDGEAWNSGGEYWVVLLHRTDKKLVVISDESVCEYEDQDAFEEARARAMIVLR
jgi:hypothetical protein